ncbi:MAG: hypothetical protein AB7U29_01480 [Desulfobulbus sp.]
MGPQEQNDQALKRVCTALRGLRGGVTDTSTLIYLDTLKILPLAGQWVQLMLIPQVVTEFGRQPVGMPLVTSASTTTTDEAVVQTAITLDVPLFSEDGRMLRKTRRLQHPHYNSLMLLLALHVQGILSEAQFFRLREELLGFAHYSKGVVAYTDIISHVLREMGPNRL